MAASRPVRPKPLDWSAPSHLTVFIRNLKLLRLDQREDWPDITLRSLSPSSQNQRQRIRLVEWALFYLFTIWDPEGTQIVLQRNDHKSDWAKLTSNRNSVPFSHLWNPCSPSIFAQLSSAS